MCGLKIPATAFNKAQLLLYTTTVYSYCYCYRFFVIAIIILLLLLLCKGVRGYNNHVSCSKTSACLL